MLKALMNLLFNSIRHNRNLKVKKCLKNSKSNKFLSLLHDYCLTAMCFMRQSHRNK